MVAHRLKEDARRLLNEAAVDAAATWTLAEPQGIRVLQSLLFDQDDLVRWRAIEALGRVAELRAKNDLEQVRELMRRTLWLMNDESGGLLWNGPEVIGAILSNVPALRGEFLEILASFLEEEPFRAGTRWALWRVALAEPEAVSKVALETLPASLADADPAVRGYAALALSTACGPASAAALAQDGSPLVVFDPRTGALRAITVREAASGTF